MLHLSWLTLTLLALLKLGLVLLLTAAALHLLRLGLWSLRQPAPAAVPPPLTASEAALLPHVTVQLPMYNEQAVAARAIAAACALDWPRLAIDVLDDSTDATREQIDRLVAERRRQGDDIRVLRRADRRGFKAGNLAHGLSQLAAGCEFVAIFDADFVPPPDFLRRLMPVLLTDAEAGFVQSRWGYLNEQQNLLTRVQALILDGLMLVEQPYLDAHALPLQWNGTSGIFRTQALRAAGGWLGDSSSVLTEDLDVSYRALLRGYRGRHVAAVAVPSELPAAMHAFVVQQQRWVGGGAQVLRSLLGQLMQKGLKLRSLVTLLAHLARHARQPYVALSLLWLPVLLLGRSQAGASGIAADPALSHTLERAAIWVLDVSSLRGGLALFVLSMAVYYAAARRQAGRSMWQAIVLAPCLIPLSVGLSLPLSVSLLSGLFASAAQSEFKRTPKQGDGQVAAPIGASSPSARRVGRERHPWLAPAFEVLCGLSYLGLAGLALTRAQVQLGLALAGCVGCGLLWVGLGRLRRPRL